MKPITWFLSWLTHIPGRARTAYTAFRVGYWLHQAYGDPDALQAKPVALPWKRAAKLLRRKVTAWQATSAGWRGECMEAERQVRKLEEELEFTGRCAFCGLPFDHGETGIYLQDFRRWYCTACRDEIDAAEKAEAEAEAKVDMYARHGVGRKDFY